MCWDRRVLLRTGKEYLKSLLAKIVPESVRNYVRSLPPVELKQMQEVEAVEAAERGP